MLNKCKKWQFFKLRMWQSLYVFIWCQVIIFRRSIGCSWLGGVKHIYMELRLLSFAVVVQMFEDCVQSGCLKSMVEGS